MPGDAGMETLAVVNFERPPRMGELLEITGSMFQVVQVVHTPFDSDQDAIVILRKRG